MPKINNSFDHQLGLKRARRDQFDIVEPKANELQIDLDGARALRRYGKQFSYLQRAGLTTGWQERIAPSKRKGHAHITITLPRRIGNLKRVCLQAILASDLVREAFNYVRVEKRNRYPIVFFEKGKTHEQPRKTK